MSQFSTGRAPEPISAPVLGPAVPPHGSPTRSPQGGAGLPAPFYRGQQRAPEPQAVEAARPPHELPWMSPDDEARDAPVALESAPGWQGAAPEPAAEPAEPEAPAFEGAARADAQGEADEMPVVSIEELAPDAAVEDPTPVVAIGDLAPDAWEDEATPGEDATAEVVDYEIYQAPNAAQLVQPDEAEMPLDLAEPWESALLADSVDAPEPAAEQPAADALPAWEPVEPEEPTAEREPEVEELGQELPSWGQPEEAEPEATSAWETPLPEFVEADVVEDDAARPAEAEQGPPEPTPSDAAAAMVAAASAGAPAPATALAEIAERLEHIARALREKSPADLIGGPDPLQALIAGYALGYTDAARRQKQDPSQG